MGTIETLKARIQRVRGEQEALQRQQKQMETAKKQQEQEADLCGKATMLLIEMTKALAAAGEEKTEQLLAMGLNSVFTNQPTFSVSLEHTRRRGVANVDILLEQDGRKADPSDYGGGILAVLSLLFQVIVIVKTGMARMLLIDEKLVHVSPEYRSKCLDLLRKLCDQLGFEILLTTNQEDFHSNEDNKADLVISVEKKGTKLVVVEEKRPTRAVQIVPSA